MQLRYKKNRLPFGAGENRPLGETLGPFRKRLFWAPLLLGGLVACSIPGGVHPLLILGTGIGFMGIYLFSHWVFSRRGEAQDHVRFSPVLILKTPAFNRELSRFMLPHALAALLCIPLSLAFSGPAPVEGARFLKDAPPPVREAEYRAHAAFQASFSFRSLGQNPQAPVQGPAAGEADERAYFRYVLGDDGLIAGNAPARSVEAAGHDMSGIPPFTLGDLMEALEPGNGSIRSGRGPAFGELPPVFAALLLSLPALLRFRREDKPGKNRLVYKEKEIAA
jgi:hypothetical protein